MFECFFYAFKNVNKKVLLLFIDSKSGKYA